MKRMCVLKVLRSFNEKYTHLYTCLCQGCPPVTEALSRQAEGESQDRPKGSEEGPVLFGFSGGFVLALNTKDLFPRLPFGLAN